MAFHLFVLLLLAATAPSTSLPFLEAPNYLNSPHCPSPSSSSCDPSDVHVAMTLDLNYLRGTIAAIHSILRHSSCPNSIFFHLIAYPDSIPHLRRTVTSTFPSLRFQIYPFPPSLVLPLISPSLRAALDNPLNYARIHLHDLLPSCVSRVVYLDSDVIVVDDIRKLFSIQLRPSVVLAAPEYCHVNFTRYFTDAFWNDEELSRAFDGRARRPCYFNTGVLVVDLEKWREGDYAGKVRAWMEVQRRGRPRIYELGSQPPMLLALAGEGVQGVGRRWNQHGLGGDNKEGRCRGLHSGGVSLLHWSGKGKPWKRIDEGRPCPVDRLWQPYDLFSRGKETSRADAF